MLELIEIDELWHETVIETKLLGLEIANDGGTGLGGGHEIDNGEDARREENACAPGSVESDEVREADWQVLVNSDRHHLIGTQTATVVERSKVVDAIAHGGVGADLLESGAQKHLSRTRSHIERSLDNSRHLVKHEGRPGGLVSTTSEWRVGDNGDEADVVAGNDSVFGCSTHAFPTDRHFAGAFAVGGTWQALQLLAVARETESASAWTRDIGTIGRCVLTLTKSQ